MLIFTTAKNISNTVQGINSHFIILFLHKLARFQLYALARHERQANQRGTNRSILHRLPPRDIG
jgi:hypothetical protein